MKQHAPDLLQRKKYEKAISDKHPLDTINNYELNTVKSQACFNNSFIMNQEIHASTTILYSRK